VPKMPGKIWVHLKAILLCLVNYEYLTKTDKIAWDLFIKCQNSTEACNFRNQYTKANSFMNPLFASNI